MDPVSSAELTLLLHSAVANVLPQSDHAQRALNARRRRTVTITSWALGALVGAAAVGIGFLTVPSYRAQQRRDAAAAQRWERSVTLDGGRVDIRPPQATDTMSLTKAEAEDQFARKASRQTPAPKMIAARWGRVTVLGSDGRPIPGFDAKPAWALIYRSGAAAAGSCPAETATAARPRPGDYSGVQVFAIAADGSQVQYSQPGSWVCGLPATPIARVPEGERAG